MAHHESVYVSEVIKNEVQNEYNEEDQVQMNDMATVLEDVIVEENGEKSDDERIKD